MSRLIILADDVTGACDAGVKFVPFGYATDAWFSWEPYDPEKDTADAATINTATRALPPEEAKKVLRTLLSSFKNKEDLIFYKKTDSLLRGNVGAEIEAMLDADENAAALLCPALPDQGRSVTGGAIRAVLADGTAMALPVADAVAATSDTPTAHIPLDVVKEGAEAVRAAMEQSIREDIRFFTADADGEQDLDTLASISLPGHPVIFAGSAGLAKALGKREARGGGENDAAAAESGQRVLCVVGSISPSAISQLAAVREQKAGEIFAFPKEYLRGECRQNFAADAERVSASGADVIVLTTGDASEGRSIPVTENTSGTEITDAFAAIAEEVLRRTGISRLFLTGGETAASFFHRTGVDHARLVDEPIAGMVSMKILAGGRQILAVTKSGSFGDENAIVDIARILKH